MTATAEQKAEMMRAALAEFGYGGGADVQVHDGRVTAVPSIPRAVRWTAARLVVGRLGLSGSLACWSCWMADLRPWFLAAPIADACRAGNCAHPDGPHEPPRELLLAATRERTFA